MDIRTLNYFIKAAEFRNFSKAAETCYISQTAMSLAIAKLEDEVGYKLFERKSRPLKLTKEGMDFYEWAVQTKESYALLTQKCNKNISENRFSIGFTNSYDAVWLNDILREFKKKYDHMVIEERIIPVPAMKEKLYNHDVDAVFLPLYVFENDSKIHSSAIATFPMTIVVNREHELAARSSVSVKMLRNYDCVFLTYANVEHVEYTFNRHMEWEKIQFNSIMQMETIDEVLLYTAMNDNIIAFLPEICSSALTKDLVMLPIDKCSMNLPFGFCCLAENDNFILRTFLEMMKK